MQETMQILLVFVVLAGALVMFVWGRLRYDVVVIGALLMLAILGIVPAEEAFKGFGHPAVITVIAVLVVSRGLLSAGVVDSIARLLGKAGDRLIVQVVLLCGIVVLCSGFMNNVGALALLMPVAVWMSRKSGRSPSLFLMPMAFASLLGGLVTLIGTPPNIIISTYRGQNSSEPFRMFDFAPVGAGVAVVGLIFLVLIGWRLAPKREGKSGEQEFEIEDYISEVKVTGKSRLIGKPLRFLMTELNEETDVLVVGIVRDGKRTMAPSHYEVIQEDDVLMVEANSEELKTILDSFSLELAESKEITGQDSLGSDEVKVVEAVISVESTMRGKTAKRLDLRNRYGINLLAVARRGQQLRQQLSQMKLMSGDIVLLQGTEDTLQNAMAELGCLPLAERGLRFGRTRKIVPALGIFVTAIVLAALSILPVTLAFLSAALIMVMTKIITLTELYKSIDWKIVVLLGAMIPVGEALDATGGADLIAEQMVSISSNLPAVATLAILMIGSMLLSNIVNNAAAAVLLAPIAVSIAGSLSLSIDAFLMAVAVGASCAFLTPIGHQSNALVMEPGGYRFSDYWKMGLPLSAIVVATALPLILLFWPLR